MEIEFDPFFRILAAPMPSTHLIVLCTVPDGVVADRIAQTVIEERLAACVNRIPGVSSIFHWHGKVQHEDEVLLLMKTVSQAFPALEARIRTLHPNTVPEIIAVQIAAGSAPYLDWITESTTP